MIFAGSGLGTGWTTGIGEALRTRVCESGGQGHGIGPA